MHRTWLVARYWLPLCAAGWLGSAAGFLERAPTRQAAAAPAAAPRGPLTVANPYAGPDGVPAWALRVPMPAKRSAAAPRVVGDAVDANTPVTYRLPKVSSFAPAPVDAAANAPPQPVLPPPPFGNAPAPVTKRRVASSSVSAAQAQPVLKLPAPQAAWPFADSPPPLAPAPTVAELATEPRGNERAENPPAERSMLADSTVGALPAPAVEPQSETQDAAMPPIETLQDVTPDVTPEAQQAAPPVVEAPPYTPVMLDLTSQLLPAVQRGYALAQRGALYAAQTEFVQVLRRTAQAKDIALGSDQHARALAAGLRAIDEAEDFVPSGVQMEAELDVRSTASSHRTPVLKDCPQEVLPHEAVACYHRFAQEKLAYAVAGEQAGSMGLHGLGKIYARLASAQDDDVQLGRNATTMYAAALAARSDNHLAANELGVMLCRCGRAAEAAQLFERTIDVAPSALAYHNLAVAQGKLGMHGQAAANEQESQRLAAWERSTGAVSRRAGVQWVSPEEMARVAQPAPLIPAGYSATRHDPPTPPAEAVSHGPAKSPWQKTIELAKSLPLPGGSKDRQATTSTPRLAPPFAAPPAPSPTQWR